MAYADDVVLLTEEKGDMKSMMARLDIFGKERVRAKRSKIQSNEV